MTDLVVYPLDVGCCYLVSLSGVRVRLILLSSIKFLPGLLFRLCCTYYLFESYCNESLGYYIGLDFIIGG